MFYVYLLKSQINKSFYIGQTADIKERIKRHNAGKVKATCKDKPWKLMGYESCATRREERWREYTLKHSYSQKKKFISKFSKD